jgi:DNA-binding NarL/FixJ family response regulator
MSKKYNILHLDDSVLFLDFTKMILDDDRWAYHPVSTEKEVEAYFKQHKTDLFICDLMLYDESDAGPGVELIEKIHKKYPSVKIMVLSARGDDSLRERLINKIVYYATKDLRDTQLKKIVISLLEGDTI